MDIKRELTRIKRVSPIGPYIKVPLWPYSNVQDPEMTLDRAILIIANKLPDREPHGGEWDYASALFALVKLWSALNPAGGDKIGQEWG